MYGYGFRDNSNRTSALVGVIAASAASFVVYWLTAYRTIAWWDSAEYTAVALSLGVAHPPGSLLLTILGWLITKIPWGVSDTFVLSLTAAVVASLVVGVVFYLARFNSRVLTDRAQVAETVAAIFASLIMAFGITFWSYATKFSPVHPDSPDDGSHIVGDAQMVGGC